MPLLVYASGMALGLCLYACVVRDAGHAAMAAVVVAAATETMLMGWCYCCAGNGLQNNDTAEDITTE